jgi:hypothetical protein
LEELLVDTNFPWLMSNAIDLATKKPLANAKAKYIAEFNGLRVCILGFEIFEFETSGILMFLFFLNM